MNTRRPELKTGRGARRRQTQGRRHAGIALGGANDANSRGTLIPTTGVAQYGATLAQWFGVDPASLPTVFPNIGNFTTTNLGFLG